jgi:hypothetical protein
MAKPLAPGGDLQQDEAGQQAAGHLGDDVRDEVLGRETAAGPQADADRRIEVRAGDMAERIGAGHHGQAEGERYAEEPDTQRIAVTPNLAASTALPQPPRTSQNVPRDSADNLPMLMCCTPLKNVAVRSVTFQ